MKIISPQPLGTTARTGFAPGRIPLPPWLRAFLLMVACAPAAFGQPDFFSYTVSEGAATLVRYAGHEMVIAVPATVNGFPVTKIGNRCFASLAFGGVQSVVIPEGIRSIEKEAFDACRNLTNVVLPNSLTNIATRAFASCSKLPRITIPEGVKTLGADAFYFCVGLDEIDVAPSNTEFSGREGVLFNKDQTILLRYPAAKEQTDYSIPDSVIRVEPNAFLDSPKLQTLFIPKSVAEVGDGSGNTPFRIMKKLTHFIVDPANPHYMDVDGVLYAKAPPTVLRFPEASPLRHFAVPQGTIEILPWAFVRATGLASVFIPDSVSQIGDFAFSECGGLSTVVFGKGLRKIGQSAFASCSNLVSVTIPSGVTSFGPAPFSRCFDLKHLFFEGDAPLVNEQFGLGGGATTVFYLPGATGWGASHGKLPTQLWNPAIATGEAGFGLDGDRLQFVLTGNNPASAGARLVVEAASDLSSPLWTPVSTNVLAADGTTPFADPEAATSPSRVYRFRVQ